MNHIFRASRAPGFELPFSTNLTGRKDIRNYTFIINGHGHGLSYKDIPGQHRGIDRLTGHDASQGLECLQ